MTVAGKKEGRLGWKGEKRLSAHFSDGGNLCDALLRTAFIGQVINANDRIKPKLWKFAKGLHLISRPSSV